MRAYAIHVNRVDCSPLRFQAETISSPWQSRNLRRFSTFLDWFPLRAENVRADLVAGITCALLAIPQSLAYAQLAGVPAYYGLYAALIPALIGVMFGSSGLLSTGPVAMTSLLTAASISQLAPHGSEQYYAYVILLALVSGVFRWLRHDANGRAAQFSVDPVLMDYQCRGDHHRLSQPMAIPGIPTARPLISGWRIRYAVVTGDSARNFADWRRTISRSSRKNCRNCQACRSRWQS